MKHNIVYENGKPVSVTLFRRGKSQVAGSDHPNFNEIVVALESQRPAHEVASLFDQGSALVRGFRRAAKLIKKVMVVEEGDPTTPQAQEALAKIAEGIEVKDGALYFQHERMAGPLADAILLHYRDKREEAFMPLVRFLGKVMANPNPHSREHLYKWMQHKSFGINNDGDIVAYKGVYGAGKEKGQFVSTTAGDAIVDGRQIRGRQIPNRVGSTVEMPRSEVTFDPNEPCSAGLHVGTVSYARKFGNHMIEVRIDPRDVVSVPNHDGHQKMRVCKYKVVRDVSYEEVSTLGGTKNLVKT